MCFWIGIFCIKAGAGDWGLGAGLVGWAVFTLHTSYFILLMGYEWIIIRRHLFSVGRRMGLTTIIAIIGVGLGVGALVITLSVMNGYADMIFDRQVGINPHITVRRPYSERIENYAPIVQLLEKHPEVVGANPVIETEGYVLSRVKDVGTVTSGVLVRGVDGIVKSSDIAYHITEGKMELTRIEGNNFGIAIGKTLAEKLGASVGSKIRLLAAPKDLTTARMPPLRQYVITGIFETGFYEFDASLIYISLAAAQRDLQWGDLATGIQVRLVNAFEANRVSVELRETLAATYFDMFPTSWMYAQGNLYAWIQLQKWASFVVLSLIVVVAGFNIISILTMAVNERKREIGILKAMGAAPKSIAQIFSREGLIIGASGVLFGNILGGGLCWIQKVYAPISLSGDVYFINALPVTINILDFAMISALALLLCLVFARWPAKRAATLDPVESIRYE